MWPFSFAGVLLEVGIGAYVDACHFGSHGALCGRRVLAREADDWLRGGLEHQRGEAVDAPALPEREAFLVDVAEAPLFEAGHGPRAGVLQLRRPGDTRAVDIGEPRRGGERLRGGEAPFLDAADGGEVYSGLCRKRGRERDQRARQKQASHRFTPLG